MPLTIGETMTEQHRWGWVDDDGTVHVKLPQGGDAIVGQFAAGDADAALAFFERKFADVVAEVRLTAERLQQGRTTPDQADAAVSRLRETLAAPTFVGDIGGLSELLDTLHTAAAERRLTNQAEKARARGEALSTREAIAAEAEQLATSTQWKATSERFKELLEQWKALPRFDKKTEEALWGRFSAARSAFDKTRRAHFAQLDATRAEAVQVKNALIAEAQELSSSQDWAQTTRAYRDLLERWKAAPRASRQQEDALWAKFHAAREAFFSARNNENAVRDADQVQNQTAKEALLQRAEALLPVSDAAAARQSLRGILAEWDAIGHVPRSAKQALDTRLQKVEDAVGRAERREWQRTDPAMRERAEQTVSGFLASVSRLEGDLAAAQAAGNAKKAAAVESSLESTRALLAAAQRVLAEYGG
jgi:hypothetical protein